MRKADIVRAKTFIEKYDVGTVMEGINSELALMDRCADMLRSVAPAPKPEKAAKAKAGKRKAFQKTAEVEG